MLSSVAIATFIGSANGQTPASAPAASAPATSQPAPVPFKPIPHVEKRGDGPINMVLIPGLSCDWTVYDAFMKRNEHKYTMYAVTLPGFGGSDAPAAPAKGQFGAWLDNADAAIWKVVEDQKIDKPVVVGHSLGGHLALRIGAEHAQDLRAVIAIDGAPAFPFGMASATPNKDQRLTMAKQMAAMYANIPADQWAKNQGAMVAGMVTDPKRAAELAELCGKVPQTTTVQYMVDLVAADIRDQLPKLTVPTLVTPSAASRNPALLETNRAVWLDLMKGAPQATLAFFEDTRHFIIDDRPAELDLAIVEFLDGKPVHGYAAPAEQPATKPAESR
jgi:pimeloyl-ACP methyl ester carboxylesterase